MKCSNCGYEIEETFEVCPRCQTQMVVKPAAKRILPALHDKWFLALCLLMSVSCLLGLSGGGVPVIQILLTVFLWLTHSQSHKGIADERHLRCISGTVYAEYVIQYVAAILVGVLGVIFALVFSYLANDPAFMETLASAVVDEEFAYVIDTFAFVLTEVPSVVIAIICIAAGVLVILVNIFILRYIHRFAQSIYKSLEGWELDLVHTNAAMVSLFVLGGFSAVSGLSALFGGELFGLFSNGVSAAVNIIAGLLIRKYFSSDPAEQIN